MSLCKCNNLFVMKNVQLDGTVVEEGSRFGVNSGWKLSILKKAIHMNSELFFSKIVDNIHISKKFN